MKVKFREIKLGKANKVRLEVINNIVREYQAQDLVLSLRQLYYQLVVRDVIPNKQAEYSKLSNLLKEGRMAGIVDWAAIEDRLRRPSVPSAWETPADLLRAAISQYEKPRMKGQATYLEVWVEKDALSGVLSRVTEPYHVPILVNRGYSSASAMYDAYKRFKKAHDRGQKVKVIYLGDFDPSGVDMIRDIRDRITEFISGAYLYRHDRKDWSDDFEILPVALTRAQIDQYEPPPNPAKLSDSRAAKFVEEHGYESWEVDALPPEVLNQIVTDAIEENINRELYDDILEQEKTDIEKLEKITDDFNNDDEDENED